MVGVEDHGIPGLPGDPKDGDTILEEQGTTSQEPRQRVSQWWVVPLLRILSLHFVSEKLYSLRHKKNDVLGFKIYQKECHFT
jgi:hypothetical protein